MQGCLPLFTLVTGTDGRIIAHNIGLQSVHWHLKEPGMCHWFFALWDAKWGTHLNTHTHTCIYIYVRIYIYIYVWTGYPCHSLPKLLVWLKHISPAKYMQTGILGIETASSGVLVSFGVLKSHAKVMFSYLETRFLLTWINFHNVVVSDTGLSPNLPTKISVPRYK